MSSAPSSIDATPSLAVQLRGVEKAFGTGDTVTRALRHTDFDAHRGELLLLVGPSGCGKTTLLSILAGTLVADSGEINVLGHALHILPESERTHFRSRHLGFIFQQFNLISTLSVVENVAVPLLIQGQPLARAMDRARAMLDIVGLGNRSTETPNRLSGGQQQRIAIARALVHEPPLIVCDEPTSALDRENGHLVMELLRKVARDPKRTVIVVTHDPRIYHFGDRMAEMEDGRIFKILPSNAEILRAHGTG
jgi:putative ABC transport system ATP-binding protein